MRVLVTGAGTGIGRATAIELTERGHEVVATARRAEVLTDLDVAERLILDVTDQASVARAIAEAGDLEYCLRGCGSCWSHWMPFALRSAKLSTCASPRPSSARPSAES